MKQILVAVFSGLLFGLGLAMSGMLIPEKVLNFLDVFGNWDPTLGVVMAGALFINLPATWLILKKTKPKFSERFRVPNLEKLSIDRRLIIGAILFGVGWGLVGLCPGPATVMLFSGSPEVLMFFTSMVSGMLLYGLLFKTS